MPFKSTVLLPGASVKSCIQYSMFIVVLGHTPYSYHEGTKEQALGRMQRDYPGWEHYTKEQANNAFGTGTEEEYADPFMRPTKYPALVFYWTDEPDTNEWGEVSL